MVVAMARDIRVLVIKLADRLHNARTWKFVPVASAQRKARETLEIYAPLAHRLGMNTIKWELEDLSFMTLYPKVYDEIVRLVAERAPEREQYLDIVRQEVTEDLRRSKIRAEVTGRPKHYYSIYQKMIVRGRDFADIYDLVGVRVLVDSVRDCYAALGALHARWNPVPGRFKDYIAMPKPNLYQSLHTTVIGPGGDPLEVQIRTKEMHEIAEYGIAAHWAYKEGRQINQDDEFIKKLTWFREILDWQNETHDAEEFMESLKIDLFSDMVYVFTPKGDVIELPAGSIPIDFAYRIHTEIGNQTIGAKVNGKMEPLDYKLQNGDIVEVLTSKHSYGPSQDWLKITQTSKAKNKIKQFFKKQRKEESIIKGKELIEKEIIATDLDPKEVLTQENLNKVFEKFNFTHVDDMYAAVGYQGVTASAIVTKLTEDLVPSEEEEALSKKLQELMDDVKPKSQQTVKSSSGVRVKGMDNLLVRLSRWCNPVPGDDIIGYITRGRGVSVHRVDCPNIQSKEAKQRYLPVEWDIDPTERRQYHLDLEISGYDRQGLLNDILQAISETKTNITKVNGRSDQNKMAFIKITILIRNTGHLQRVVDRIKKIKDVYTVTRTIN